MAAMKTSRRWMHHQSPLPPLPLRLMVSPTRSGMPMLPQRRLLAHTQQKRTLLPPPQHLHQVLPRLLPGHWGGKRCQQMPLQILQLWAVVLQRHRQGALTEGLQTSKQQALRHRSNLNRFSQAEYQLVALQLRLQVQPQTVKHMPHRLATAF